MNKKIIGANENAVRPQDSIPRLFLANLLTAFRKAVGGDRFENLFQALAAEILEIKDLQRDGRGVALLDFGCGVMSFSRRLQSESVVESFVGMDIFPVPDLINEADVEKWKHYQQIPENDISQVSGNFDLSILTDVLHHARPSDQVKILKKLSTISRFILIKDHFEYGLISRQILRLADWYGNYAYGVNIPCRYFNEMSWQSLIKSAGLKEVKIKVGVRVHDGLFGLLIPPKYHFISILTR